MLRTLLIALSRIGWLKRFVTRNPIARRVARRFVAGEAMNDAMAVVEKLMAEGMDITLDCLGENVHTPEAAARAADQYREILAALRARGLRSHMSLKLTQLGLDLGEDLCLENLERILADAITDDTFVRVDMESSDYTERTLRIVERAHEKYSNVGIVIQSYLRRSVDDVARLNAQGIRVRLCKGAYAEPPEVAYQSKAEVDASFVRLMQDLMAAGHYPAMATHDEKMIQATLEYAKAHRIPASEYEFQMLYGIRRDRQASLKREGYNIRLYVPFGTEWYPYFMRRLAERPANLVFILTALVRG